MRVAIITDLHWGVRNSSLFFLNRIEEFYYGVFFPYLEENSIDTVWILGDFYENRKHISVEVLNRSHLFLKEFEKRGIQVYCIIGNHDTVYRNTNTVNSIIPTTSAFSNIHVIEKYECFNFDGLDVGFISWINPDIKEECLDWIRRAEINILCGHFEINGFEVVKGVLCSNGLSTSLFQRFDHVLSGHFHIRNTKDNISYMGNPYQTNWGEYGYDKGFHILDTHTREITFIKNPIETFNLITYDDSLDVISFDPSIYKNKVIRIYADKTENKKKLDLLIDRLTAYAFSIEVVHDRTDVKDKIEISPKKQTIEMISDYIKSYSDGSLNTSLIESLTLEIYNEAIERLAI